VEFVLFEDLLGLGGGGAEGDVGLDAGDGGGAVGGKGRGAGGGGAGGEGEERGEEEKVERKNFHREVAKSAKEGRGEEGINHRKRKSHKTQKEVYPQISQMDTDLREKSFLTG
jgi:hypothetical protein